MVEGRPDSVRRRLIGGAAVAGLTQRSDAVRPLKKANAKDARETLAYLSLAAPALTLPERALPRLARAVARVAALRAAPAPKVEAYRRAVLGPAATPDRQAEIDRGVIESYLLDRFYLLRCHRPGGWRPEARIEGDSRIASALERGSGALLWVMPLRVSDFVTKIALARAGHGVAHLSRFSHPGSNTRYGLARLNPVRTKIESRYVERVVIGRDNRVGGRPTLDVLAERLRANGIVSITVGDSCRHTLTVPLLSGAIRLSTGPAHLAASTGAPLIPISTVAEAPGRFLVDVGAPLDAGGQPPGPDRIEAMSRDFANRLGPFARHWPEQFPWTRFCG